jgi:prepilin-type N-terminal cleavage/methylation domain-containing protein
VTRPRATAFTLVEVLVVIAVLGVVAAGVAVPLSGALASAGPREAVASVVQADRLARREAASLGRPVRVDYAAGDRRLRLPRGVVVAPLRPVEYSTLGASRTFAVELRGRDGWRAHVVFAGPTGRHVEVADAAEADRIVDEPAGGRDAD